MCKQFVSFIQKINSFHFINLYLYEPNSKQFFIISFFVLISLKKIVSHATLILYVQFHIIFTILIFLIYILFYSFKIVSNYSKKVSDQQQQIHYLMEQHQKIDQKSSYQKFSDFVCCIRQPKAPKPYRFQIDVHNQPAQNSIHFQSNYIRTAKYSLISFLPKALILQFKRIANCYFLLIAILLSIKVISPLNPLTAWAPLIIVIGISMIRQGYQDYQRYRSDEQANKRKVRIIRNGEEHQKQSKEIIVGDICHVKKNQFFPADLILLTSSFPSGAAFIETASLDGQKNLKPRNAFQQTSSFSLDQLKNLKGQFQGNDPDPELHKYSGKIVFGGQMVGRMIVIEGDKQLLYRQAKLMNTQYIYGLVIYTGRNTKIMKNSESSSPQKMSQVQKKVNYILGIVLIIQIIFCIITAIIYGIFRNNNKNSFYYVDWTNYSSPVDSIIIFFTYFVLINTMIPISLIVSIQMVKLFQKYFIDHDKFMTSQWKNGIGCQVKSASLNEQLGQIQYVFSDKTGTLTKNQMEFKIATIGPQMFGDVALIAPKGSPDKPSEQIGFHDQNLKILLRSGTGDKQLAQPIYVKNSQGQQKLKFKSIKQIGNQYFIALSTAHEVIVEVENGKKKYQGPSPDECGLVQAAAQMNYQFVASTQNSTTVKILGKQQTYQVLALFPFTSDRKRMSIVVKDKHHIKMYTKGADNIVKSRLAKDNQLNLDDQLNRFSVIGLRTLLIGMRVISDKQYNDFKSAINNLPATNREKQLQDLISKLQSNLYLIGATAVLDRLQDQVPQTIRDLIRANVHVWMLTGDKMETAQNIAKSCNLIQPHFHILRYKPPSVNQSAPKPKSRRDVLQKQNNDLQTAQNLYQAQNTVQAYIDNLVKQTQQLTQSGLAKALLIEGSDLNTITNSKQNQKKLAKLAQNCQAVVCCRLLPKQKKQIVRIVRENLNKITLSIGDGANDVQMIKEAHIGVGLFGFEGMGAVQAADYALPQFRMLWRLLFVHGRWNYIRISQMILYFFYKNMVYTLPQWLTAFYCGYSGQTLYDDVYVTLYNLIFTALPLIVRAVLQQDVNYIFKAKQSYQQFPKIAGKSMISQNERLPQKYQINKFFYRLFPKIYFIGQQNCIFNYKNYFAWLIEAMLQSTLITVIIYFILSEPSINGEGYNSSFWLVGLTIYSSVILVVTFKLATHTRFWSILLFITITFLSLGFYVAYMWISNYAFSDYVQGTAYVAWTSIQNYFIVLFCICMILFIDGLVVFLDFRRGSNASKMREIVYQQQINNRQFYDQVGATITSGLTASQQGN